MLVPHSGVGRFYGTPLHQQKPDGLWAGKAQWTRHGRALPSSSLTNLQGEIAAQLNSTGVLPLNGTWQDLILQSYELSMRSLTSQQIHKQAK